MDSCDSQSHSHSHSHSPTGPQGPHGLTAQSTGQEVRQATATVGLAWFRSICYNIDFDTPAWRDNSSSDKARSCRSAARVSPTRGGSGEGRFTKGALDEESLVYDTAHKFDISNF